MNSGLPVGFDIGGTNVRGIMLRDGEIVATRRARRPEAPEAMIESVVAMTAEMEAETGERAAVVGVGCAGQVDLSGVVRTSPNIPSLVHFPLRSELLGRFSCPVFVDNDATTATWAESVHPQAEHYKNIVFVAFGTGIGGGFVVDGELYRGAHGLAGEIGHMIVDPDGPACVCGRHGCWEQVASGGALGRLARSAARAGRAPTVVAKAGSADAIEGEHVAALLLEDDPVASSLLFELATQIAIGLNNLVNILDPEAIIIGGGLSDIGDQFIGAVRRAFGEVMVDRRRRPEIVILSAVHGGLAGALGAAQLAAASIAATD